MNTRKITIVNAHPNYQKPIKNIAIYCRVSSKKEEQLKSLAFQLSWCEYLKEKLSPGQTLTIYSDIGSGTTIRRTGLNKLLEDCKNGKVDLIICKSVSSLSRNTVDFLNMIRSVKAMKNNIKIQFEKEKVFTGLFDKETELAIHAAFAQSESESLSEDIKWGIRHKFKNGGFMINADNLLGYTKDENGNLILVVEEAAIVRKIYELYADGFGARKIKKYLESKNIKSPKGGNTWSTGTIDRILHNEKYLGHVLSQKTFVENPLTHKQIKNNGEHQQYLIENNHEAIVYGELLERYQARIY